MYEISPTTLKGAMDDRWGCARCFYLKVKHGIRPPEPTGLGKLHGDIHRWLYDYLRSHWLDLLPPGHLVETELEVKAKDLLACLRMIRLPRPTSRSTFDGIFLASSGSLILPSVYLTSSGLEPFASDFSRGSST